MLQKHHQELDHQKTKTLTNHKWRLPRIHKNIPKKKTIEDKNHVFIKSKRKMNTQINILNLHQLNFHNGAHNYLFQILSFFQKRSASTPPKNASKAMLLP